MLLRPLNCLLAPLLAILLAASAEAQLLDPRSSPETATGEQTHELAIA
jgi:hypothetical protein